VDLAVFARQPEITHGHVHQEQPLHDVVRQEVPGPDREPGVRRHGVDREADADATAVTGVVALDREE
jgi:hypothetical protein